MKLEPIWAEYRIGIKAFLHSKISNSADVDDLLQEILIKTHKNIGNIRSQGSIKSWLFQIANHSIIDFYRRNKAFTELDQEDSLSESLWLEQQERDIKQELSVCIAPFIQALDEEDAELLTAIDIQGESQKQYAESLGISYSTLKSRVQKARSQLRDLFEGCCKMQLDAQGNLMDYDPHDSSCKKC